MNEGTEGLCKGKSPVALRLLISCLRHSLEKNTRGRILGLSYSILESIFSEKDRS